MGHKGHKASFAYFILTNIGGHNVVFFVVLCVLCDLLVIVNNDSIRNFRPQ